jgi:hypothetical protein
VQHEGLDSFSGSGGVRLFLMSAPLLEAPLTRCFIGDAWDGRDTVLTRLLHCLPLYPFSSFFSSLKKRQSVAWAMSFCGLLLIIPASWRRRAKKRIASSGSYSRHTL